MLLQGIFLWRNEKMTGTKKVVYFMAEMMMGLLTKKHLKSIKKPIEDFITTESEVFFTGKKDKFQQNLET